MLGTRTSFCGPAIAVLAACGACQSEKDGPYTNAELNALTGQIYFAQDHGHGHDEPPAQQLFSFATQVATPVPALDGAFIYSANQKHNLVASTKSDNLVLSRPDGSEERTLASSPALDWYPRFSPDGEWVLFESARDSFRDIYKASVDGSQTKRLTNNREGNFDAVWSPDGQAIAFASSRAGSLDLWIMNADGSSPRRLTTHTGDSVKPAFSSDGQHIAFMSGRDRQDDLYIISPVGGEATKLTASRGDGAPNNVERFSWHPQSNRLLYAARTLGGQSKIYVVDVKTKTRTQLTPTESTSHEVDPCWSPDGEHIAFGSGGEIYVARADGTRRTRISESGGHAWLPRWLAFDERARKSVQERSQ